MSYIDGFVLPLKEARLDEYRKMAETFAEKVAGMVRGLPV